MLKFILEDAENRQIDPYFQLGIGHLSILFTNTVYILDKICKKTRPILTLAAKSEDQSKELHTNHIGMPN